MFKIIWLFSRFALSLRCKPFKEYNIMKKILTLLFVSLICSVGYAQHLKFKGIPLEGTLTDFVSQLKAKGFTYAGTEDGIALLQGEFAGYKNCIVGVATFSGTQNVCKVVSLFPEQETWAAVSKDYYSLKGLLTEKYGEPVSVEKFHREYVDSDSSKRHAILHGEADFVSTFTTEGGKIELTIKKADTLTLRIVLSYFDDENSSKVRQQIMDDL